MVRNATLIVSADAFGKSCVRKKTIKNRKENVRKLYPMVTDRTPRLSMKIYKFFLVGALVKFKKAAANKNPYVDISIMPTSVKFRIKAGDTAAITHTYVIAIVEVKIWRASNHIDMENRNGTIKPKYHI